MQAVVVKHSPPAAAHEVAPPLVLVPLVPLVPLAPLVPLVPDDPLAPLEPPLVVGSEPPDPHET